MAEEMEVGCARPTGGPVGESVDCRPGQESAGDWSGVRRPLAHHSARTAGAGHRGIDRDRRVLDARSGGGQEAG